MGGRMSNALVFLLSLLLPRRLWYRRFYLRSAHWRTLRERVGSARSWQCQVYGCVERGRHLDLHHVTYRLWRERGADVRLLCRRHHAQAHSRQGNHTRGKSGSPLLFSARGVGRQGGVGRRHVNNLIIYILISTLGKFFEFLQEVAQ